MSNPQELLAQLNKVAEQLGARVQLQTDTPTWGVKPAGQTLGIVGVAVPLRVEGPFGSVRVYVSIAGEAAGSQDTLIDTIRRLVDLGLPVDVYRSDREGWSGGNGGGWRSRGWNRHGRARFNGNGGYDKPWRSQQW